MKSSNTSERLKLLMKERGLRQVDVLNAIAPFSKKYNVPISKSTLSQYISGRYEPAQDKLTILGLALNVSEAWLMGFDVTPERETAAPPVSGSSRCSELMDLFVLLSDDQQAFVLRVVKSLLSDE